LGESLFQGAADIDVRFAGTQLGTKPLERVERINTESTENAEFTEKKKRQKKKGFCTAREFTKRRNITRWLVPAGGARFIVRDKAIDERASFPSITSVSCERQAER